MISVVKLPAKGDVRDNISAVGELAVRDVLDLAISRLSSGEKSSSEVKYRAAVVGEMVHCTDRDNYGKVVEDLGDKCKVDFLDGTAVVTLSKTILAQDGKPLAELPITFEPIPIGKLCAQNMTQAEPVIEGLLRKGETANIVAPPKFKKSWASYAIALNVATGGEWLGKYRCEQGRVLLIDNELMRGTIAHRIPVVAEALGIAEEDYRKQLDVWPLRGHLLDLHGICRALSTVKKDTYSLVILDALYRAYPPGLNENDNGAVAQLFNLLDETAEKINAAWILIHHASKGEQSGKSVTDVGAGAGSQSRAADAHIILREHESDGCIVLDAVVRSSPPIEPLVLKWDFPCWHPADELDPKRLKRRQSAQEEKQQIRDQEGIASIVSALAGNKKMTPRTLRNETGIGKDRFDRLLAAMLKDSRVVREPIEVKGNSTFFYQLSEVENESSESDF